MNQVYRGYLLTFAEADRGRPDRWYAERLIRTGSQYDLFYFPSSSLTLTKTAIDQLLSLEGT